MSKKKGIASNCWALSTPIAAASAYRVDNRVEMKAKIGVDAVEGKECPWSTANHQKLDERYGTESPSQLSERANPANTSILGF